MIWKQVKPAPAEAASEDFVLFPPDLEASLSHLRLFSSVNLIGFKTDLCVQVVAFEMIKTLGEERLDLGLGNLFGGTSQKGMKVLSQRTRLLILTDVYYEVKIVKEACYISEGGSSTFIQNRKPVEVTLGIPKWPEINLYYTDYYVFVW